MPPDSGGHMLALLHEAGSTSSQRDAAALLRAADRPHPAAHAADQRLVKHCVTDVVWVRNGPRDTWKRGVVTDVDPVLEVRVDGWEFACEWGEVRRHRPTQPEEGAAPLPQRQASLGTLLFQAAREPQSDTSPLEESFSVHTPGPADLLREGSRRSSMIPPGSVEPLRQATAGSASGSCSGPAPAEAAEAGALLRCARGCYARGDLVGCEDALRRAGRTLDINLFGHGTPATPAPARITPGTPGVSGQASAQGEHTRSLMRRRLREQEELYWLAGMVAKKRGDFVGAVRMLGDALSLAQPMVCAGQSRPTFAHLEALRARGTALLHRAEYSLAVRDYKEWLSLRARFAERRDPTTVLYNLALCFKHMDMLRVAEEVFARARDLASQTDAAAAAKAVAARAEDNIRVCRLIRAIDSEEALVAEIQHMRVRPTDAAQAQASKLHMLRWMVHHYLTQQSAALIRMRLEAASRSLAKRIFGRGNPQAARGRISPSNEEARNAVVSLCCALFRTFIDDSDFTREYLQRGSSPKLLEQLQKHPLHATLRQTLNFCAEFLENFTGMAGWITACLSEDERASLANLGYFMAQTPWATLSDEAETRTATTAGDEVAEMADSDDSAGELLPRRHCPQLLGVDPRLGHLPPLLSEGQRTALGHALPRRFQDVDWVLSYSSRIHGCSLHTFYKMNAQAGPNILVVQDLGEAVFGAFSLEGYTKQSGWHGSGETLVWRATDDDSVRVWHWAYHNQFFRMCREESITFGGGGSPALAIEGNLLDRGTTGHCQTFGSEPLTDPPDFEVCCVEVWVLIDDD